MYCTTIYTRNNLLCLYTFDFKLWHKFFFLGGGRSSNVNKLFILQNKIARIITNTGASESCREAFKNIEIMTYSQHIFSLIIFTVKIKHLFTSNMEIHKYKTRNNTNLHLPTVNMYFRGASTFIIKLNKIRFVNI